MARPAKRIFKNRIAAIIDSHAANLNAISHNSGISHTYLTKLVQGDINRPGKDKLASILIGLNYPTTEINAVLADYDYLPLDIPDIPAIIANNADRKIDNTTLPLYDRIYVRLLLASMEQTGGSKIVSRHCPSALYMPDELYHGQDTLYHAQNEGRRFYQAFAQELIEQRKSNFLKAARNRNNRFETYICKCCLEEYVDRQLAASSTNGDDRRRELIIRFFANAVSFVIRRPEQHIMSICNHCSFFIYQIQGFDQKKPKIIYLGKSIHGNGSGRERMRLQGFASANPSKVALFQQETELSRQTAIPDIMDDYPDRLVVYITGLFEARGLASQFTAAVDKLLETDSMY